MGAYCSSGSHANTTPRASDPSAVPGPGSKQPAKRYSNATLSDKQIQILEERNVSDAGAFSTDAVALRYAWATQRGHYPDEPKKDNQDSCIVLPQLGEFKDISFFGVFDGHGKDGHLCSRYARDHLHKNILENLQAAYSKKGNDAINMEDILTRAHLATNAGLRKCKEIDDTLSGTTSISLLLHGSTMYFSNLGDSRAVLVSLASNASTSSSSPADSGRLVAKAMSSDQTPYRKDERERVKKYGARVMTMEQIEGNAPLHENWGDLELGNEIDEGGDPPRIWSPQGDYPGTAFTRSIGDFFAEGLGVVAEPEFTVLDLSPQDKYIIIASDGVFEFLTNQMTADMIVTPDNLLNVCRAVVEVSYGLWLQYEYRTDDITIILIAIDQLTSLPTNVRTIRPKQTLSIKTNLSNDPDMNLNSNSPRVMTSRPIRRRPKKKFMILNSADDADANDGVVVPFSEPKTPQEAQSIRNAIQSNFLFQNIGASQRNAIIDAMVKVEVDADEVVILQGDKGDRFYIVERGRYEVRMKTEDGRPAPDDGRATHFKFGIYGQWRHEYTTANNTHPCFGELSLMYGKPRGATVIALEPGVLWALDRKDFRNLLLRSISSRRRILDNLRRVKILRCLDVSDIQRLADVLSENTFPAGSTIIEQGTPGDNFYMIIEGKCRVTVKGEEGAKKAKAEVINRLGEWEYFGERALLSNEPHSCNVIADTDVKVHYINKASFDEIFGPLAQLMEQDRAHREDLAKLEMRLPTSMAEIKLDALVGQGETSSILLGTFASVTLTVYSFVLSKVEQAGELKSLHTAVEVNALLRQSVLDISQSFLPRSACALRENNALHLLFKGGVVCDLSVFLKQQSTKSKQNSILPETVVAYIAGCVVTALAALHKASIIYRGVQPENLYVDTEGRVVLLDHRTCKVGGIDMLSYTLCGAADYLAPEQVSLTGHGRAVDLWALGVLLYEIAAGASPFAQGGEVATFHKISSLGTASYPQVQVPSFVVPTIKSLISKLIVPDPSQRLGMGLGGFDDVRLEPLFTGLHWKTLYLDPSPLQVFAKEMLNDIVVDAEGVGNIGETEGWYENSKVEFDLY